MAVTPEIGWQGQPNDLNGDAIKVAQMFSQAADAAFALQKYVLSVGTTGLLNQTGWSSADVTQFMTWCGYMHDFAAVFQGTNTQPGLFDFAGALAQLIGPPGGP